MCSPHFLWSFFDCCTRAPYWVGLPRAPSIDSGLVFAGLRTIACASLYRFCMHRSLRGFRARISPRFLAFFSAASSLRTALCSHPHHGSRLPERRSFAPPRLSLQRTPHLRPLYASGDDAVIRYVRRAAIWLLPATAPSRRLTQLTPIFAPPSVHAGIQVQLVIGPGFPARLLLQLVTIHCRPHGLLFGLYSS